MKIKNSTPVETSVLRALANIVAKGELEPQQRPHVTVHFAVWKGRSPEARKARRMGYRIRASGHVPLGLKFNQALVTIAISRIGQDPKLAAQIVAHDLAHEFAEMQGYTHKQMRGPLYFYKGNWTEHYEWAKDYPLTFKPAKPAPSTADKRAVKLAHAQARLANALRKERLAMTIRKKWQAKVKYYEKEVSHETSVPPMREAAGEVHLPHEAQTG